MLLKKLRLVLQRSVNKTRLACLSTSPLIMVNRFPAGRQAHALQLPQLIAAKCVVFFPRIFRSAVLAGITPRAMSGEDSLRGVRIMPTARMDAPAEHINPHKALIKSAAS
jgi:hypothetical protein